MAIKTLSGHDELFVPSARFRICYTGGSLQSTFLLNLQNLNVADALYERKKKKAGLITYNRRPITA
jgi:hypothetical protein